MKNTDTEVQTKEVNRFDMQRNTQITRIDPSAKTGFVAMEE
ncbi:hypothetical protein ACQCT6_14095 [Cytobacillus gottheilii]